MRTPHKLFGSTTLLPEASKPEEGPDNKSAVTPLFVHVSDDEDGMILTQSVDNADTPISERTVEYENDFYLNETYFDVIPNSSSDTAVYATEWGTKHPSSSEWSQDDASTHRKLHEGSLEASKLGPAKGFSSKKDVRDVERNASSNFKNFMRPDPNNTRVYPPLQTHSKFGLTGENDLTIRTSAALLSGATETQESDQVQLDDPLAEFDRWVASGAVDIIPN